MPRGLLTAVLLCWALAGFEARAQGEHSEGDSERIRTYLGEAFLDGAGPEPTPTTQPESGLDAPEFTVPFLQESLRGKKTNTVMAPPLPFFACVPSRERLTKLPWTRGIPNLVGQGVNGLQGRMTFLSDGGHFVEFRSELRQDSHIGFPNEDFLRLIEERMTELGERYLDLITEPPRVPLCEALNIAFHWEVTEADLQSEEDKILAGVPKRISGLWRYSGYQLVAHCVEWGYQSAPVNRHFYPWLSEEAVEQLKTNLLGYEFRGKAWILYLRGTGQVSPAYMGTDVGAGKYAEQLSRYVVDADRGYLIHWDVWPMP